MPLNARIWISDLMVAPGDVRLRGPEGDVALTVGHLLPGGLGSLNVYTPKVPLTPNAEYTLTHIAQESVMGSFRTGSTVDSAAPSLPTELGRAEFAERTPLSSCGETQQRIELEVEWEAPFVLVHIAGSETPAPPDLEQMEATAPPYIYPKEGTGGVSVGRAACRRWPAGIAAGHLWYGTLDLAGNFSGWLDAGPVMLPPLPGEGDAGVRDAALDTLTDAPGDAFLDSSASSPEAAPGADAPSAPQPARANGGGGCRVGRPGADVDVPGIVAGLGLLILWGRLSRRPIRRRSRPT